MSNFIAACTHLGDTLLININKIDHIQIKDDYEEGEDAQPSCIVYTDGGGGINCRIDVETLEYITDHLEPYRSNVDAKAM